MERGRPYHPDNIQPEYFLRAPTHITTYGDVEYLNKEIASMLEGGKDFDSRVSKLRELRIGSEFEIIFFDPSIDPEKAKFQGDNPNYGVSHQKKMFRINDDAEAFVQKSKAMESLESIGRLSIEYRTAPSSVKEYLRAIDIFRDHISWISKRYMVLPSVISQHLHVSLFSSGENLIYNARGKNFHFGSAIQVAMQNLAPLLQAPEEFKYDALVGTFRFKTPPRYEFRLLSTEYACDPWLNSLISLYALHNGLVASEKDSFTSSSQAVWNYRSAIDVMKNHTELKQFFGASLISKLADAASYYPAVSTRTITLPEVYAKIGKQRVRA